MEKVDTFMIPPFLRKNPKPFQIIDNETSCPPPGQGDESMIGYYALDRI